MASSLPSKFNLNDLDNLDRIITDKLYDKCLSDYYTFIKTAWSTFDPAEFSDNWHIGCIAYHVQAALKGELRRLIINISPRTGKSTATSICGTAWLFLQNPSAKLFNVTAADRLFIQNISYAKEIINSNWYQSRWGLEGEDPKYGLSDTQNAKTRFDTTEQGYILGTTPNSKVFGMGFTHCIIDDPNDSEESENPNNLKKVNAYYDRTLRNRSNNRDQDVIILVQQRVKADDLSGYLLAQKYGFVHLNLPAEFDKRRAFISPINPKYSDPRKKDGELLDPKRLSEDTLAEEKKNYSNYSAKYLQNPTPDSGNIIRHEWLNFYPETRENWGLLDFDIIYWICDYSFTGDPESSYTVLLLMGKKGDDYYILEMIRDRMAYHAQIEATSKAARDFSSTASKFIIEQKANGGVIISALEKILQAENISAEIIGITPLQYGGSKEQRLAACIPTLVNKHLYLPLNNVQTPTIITELTSFPKGDNDDIVDCVVYGILWGNKYGGGTNEIYLPTRPEDQAIGWKQYDSIRRQTIEEESYSLDFLNQDLDVASITHKTINDIFIDNY